MCPVEGGQALTGPFWKAGLRRKDRTREGSTGEGRQRRGQEREEGAEKQWHF